MDESHLRTLIPPAPSRGLLSDVRLFLLTRPAIPTLVEFDSSSDRENYSQRILQRLGVSVREYAVLNIHRIGINAPVGFVFEELLGWDAGSLCWPNRIATPEREGGSLERVRFYLFNKRESVFGLRNGFLGLRFIPLFQIDKLEFRDVPDPAFDNARYFLYECSGGYPIGVFFIYVRSSIAAQGEQERTQVFFVVGFDFYGREDQPRRHLIGRVWEAGHNRVTANILNRFKRLCEARFQQVEAGRLATDWPGPLRSRRRRLRERAP